MRRLEASVRSFVAFAVLAIGCSSGAPAPTTPPPPPPPTPAAAVPSPIAASPSAAAPSANPVSEDVYDQDDPVARSRLLLTRRCGGISRYAAIAAVPADEPSVYRVLAIIDGLDPEPHQENPDSFPGTYAIAGSPVRVVGEADLDGDEDTDLLVAPSESGCGSAGECVYGVWLRCGDDFVDVAPMYALDLEVVRGPSGRPRVVATHAQERVVFEVQMAVLTGETRTTIRIPRVAIDRRR